MLHEFVTDHRDAIVERARVRLASRRVPVAAAMELASGVPLFLTQPVNLLREQQDESSSPLVSTTDEHASEVLGWNADATGDDLLRAGLSVAQVVEGYGDVCQAITDEAIEHAVQFTSDEYRTLNRPSPSPAEQPQEEATRGAWGGSVPLPGTDQARSAREELVLAPGEGAAPQVFGDGVMDCHARRKDALARGRCVPRARACRPAGPASPAACAPPAHLSWRSPLGLMP